MRLLVLACLALSLWGQRKPEVELVGLKAHRIEEGKLVVEGRVRVTGGRPIHGITVVFDFLSSDNDPLTTLKTQVDDEVVTPGQESAFHAETPNPPGAIKCKVRVLNGAQKELRAGNTGPYIIE
jgi:hypothetical protein